MSSNIAKKYNLKSPAVKRLMREAAELSEPTEQYFAQPLEDNLFEWHFTVRGPSETDFTDGRYHGRITLPAEYPMKPPSIILLTPNGRFELGKKICLSMSAHHPETWQPSWSIRTVLLALIGFMPTRGGGAIGALDYTTEERKILADRSKTWKCDTCGMDHQTCLLEADPTNSDPGIEEAKDLATQIDFKGENEKPKHLTTQPDSTQTLVGADSSIQQQPPPYIEGNNMDPGTYEHMAQFYANMYNNQSAQYQAPPGQIISTDSSNQQTVSPSPIDASTVNTSNNPSTITNDASAANQTNVRQRAHVVGSAPNVSSDHNIPEATHTRSENRVNYSKTDNVTLFLMWIITAVLVILVLRRLAMEGMTLAKT